MANLSEKPHRTNSETIFQTIVDLRNANRVSTRQVIAEITGLKMSIVDDHIKRMKDDGRIRMVVNGVFEPIEAVREDRAVSATFMPDGLVVKLEIGDNVIDLSLREGRMAATALGGIGLQFGR